MKSAKFISIIIAALLFGVSVTFLIMKYMDTILKLYYDYRRAWNLPDAAVPDFCDGD